MGKEGHLGGQLSWKILPPSQGHGMVSQQHLHSSLLTCSLLLSKGLSSFFPPPPLQNTNQILVKFQLVKSSPFSPVSRFFSVQVRSSGSPQQGEGRCALSQGVCGIMGNIFFWCHQGREATGRQGRLRVCMVQAELWLTPLLKECVRIYSISGKGLELFCLFPHV